VVVEVVDVVVVDVVVLVVVVGSGQRRKKFGIVWWHAGSATHSAWTQIPPSFPQGHSSLLSSSIDQLPAESTFAMPPGVQFVPTRT
jgi:hypothetical protein